jgi:RNA polymerase sigma-70 factor (ECF subfamily)
VCFDEIYEKYFKEVYRFTLALCKNQTLAEEITQETLVKALDNFDSFKGTCKINTWLCQIAKNQYFNILNKDKKIDHDSEIEGSASDNFVNRLLDHEDSAEIHKLLHTLSEPYKEVFTLRVFAELSFAQVADLFGKHESWVRVTFYRAKQKIISRLEGW